MATATATATATDAEPLITLIMTVRDGARYLAQALTSVRAQTLQAWELVLWDDGSTDDTLAIARSFAETDPRIRVFSGASIGRRRALVEAHRQARGSLLGWLDADDWLAPEALARTARVIAQSGCDLVYTDHTIVDASGEEHGLGRRSRIPYSAHRLLRDFMTFHFRLFSRDIFERAGGIDPELEIAIDYDLCLRISELGRIKHLAEPLYFYREHERQMSTRQRSAQIAASAAAIRAALARRRLTMYELVVDLERGRFQLVSRPRPRRSPIGWARLALGTALPRWRTARVGRSSEASTPAVIGHWPVVRHSVFRAQLYEAAEARGIQSRPLGSTIATLMRAVWTGRGGDTLHIHGLAPLFESEEDGAVVALCALFIKTLDHALARGTRIVWIATGPLIPHPRHAARERWCRRELATRCDAIITHWRTDEPLFRELECLEKTTFAPPPNLADAYPAVSRELARDRLGIVRHDQPTLLYVGSKGGGHARGELTITGDVDARAPDEVATLFGAADAAVLPRAAAVTSGSVALAIAMGKPIVAPALPGIGELVGDEAFLYPPDGDATAVARAVDTAMAASHEWERLGRANFERARHWSWDATLAVAFGR